MNNDEYIDTLASVLSRLQEIELNVSKLINEVDPILRSAVNAADGFKSTGTKEAKKRYAKVWRALNRDRARSITERFYEKKAKEML